MPQFLGLSLSAVVRPQSGWYRGDFHSHTHHSDGVLSPPQLVDLARSEGLDFFAITDHNTIDAFPHFGAAPNMLIVPGIEVTLDDGHFNALGVEQWPRWASSVFVGQGRCRLEAAGLTVNQAMQRAAEAGWLNSINHPLLAPWAWLYENTDLSNVHCLEIWNDPSWPENEGANPSAVALWTALLNEGYRLAAIGGSDFHRPQPPAGQDKPPERLGHPSTYVYAEELSGRAILKGLRARQAYVSLGPRVTFTAEFDGHSYGIGADLGLREGAVSLKATILSAGQTMTARILKNGRLIGEQMSDPSRPFIVEASDRLDPDQMCWFRLDVVGQNGEIVVVTNPIFAGHPTTPVKTRYGDFVPNLGA